MTTLAFLAAFFHAVAAAVQQVLRKQVLDVASTFQVGAGIFGFASVFLLVVHLVSTGSAWYAGEIQLMFWLVMTLFIAANAVATILSLQVLQGETLVGAITALMIAAGLLSLGDVIFFGNIPSAWQFLGVLLLVAAFGFFWQGKSASQKKGNLKTLLKAIVSIGIYNFVTPVTNKYCAIATTATFSAWIAHAGIAVVLLSAYALQVHRGQASLGVAGKMSGKAFLTGLAVMGSLTAMSNGLLSWSFELGGSIPAALMMKRALPPIIVFLYVVISDHRAGRDIDWKQAMGIAAATGGTAMMAA